MADEFATHQTGLASPARSAEAIVPSDAAPLARATRAVYVGGAGALRVTLVSGDEAVFAAVPAGSVLPLRVAQVHATGTTATAIVGLR